MNFSQTEAFKSFRKGPKNPGVKMSEVGFAHEALQETELEMQERGAGVSEGQAPWGEKQPGLHKIGDTAMKSQQRVQELGQRQALTHW